MLRRLNQKVIGFLLLAVISVLSYTPHILANNTSSQGNVIFIHPDGTSAAHWGATRILYTGPDGRLNWDQMSNLAVYLGHMKNQLSGTSNGGAVTHATGVKVNADSFGLDENGKPVVALSGKPQTIMEEAIKAGKGTAIINSGMIHEPGTGAFLAKSSSRRNFADITKQIVESGADVILGGGEMWYLPKGVAGRHSTASQSQRTDGLNLVEIAKKKGYTVVYTRDELLKLPTNTKKVLGIFAADDTYNDETEENLKQRNLPLYVATAPTVGEQLDVTLKILSQKGKNFLIVLEEEGSDNFGNYNNAIGCLTALKRADDAVGVAMKFIEKNPNTLLVTAADSDAGGLELVGATEKDFPFNKPLPEKGKNGAPWDGKEGTSTLPFISAPDKQGRRFPFAISWSGFGDNAGGIIAKAHGFNAGLLNGTVDNTDIYRLMYRTLFGKELGKN
ncbi:alkaline phosphatase [Sphaerospermopsis kisseleviana CS-549]|uniref:Alkaline phosphatase n=2 Tax=Sphaerospermopsis TaxID=752201 RepID=A0A479ZR51_9CYAN|nr:MULTISPECIES: alkaline phosphatase [Sphaerospermopsis]MDB9444276.1 alkaline phosphatase [Sphaerospermopsis kisseleviana CS-549]BAZ82765.1 alkaline phosphatase [Sphaerospermopsis kisseleviana NIES-73]GCL35179.1 alkaline phosphatase [Sphaerospermopsis reniformis]